MNYTELKELVLKHPINVVTVKQAPRPPGYRAPMPPPRDVIFIDYVTLIKPARS